MSDNQKICWRGRTDCAPQSVLMDGNNDCALCWGRLKAASSDAVTSPYRVCWKNQFVDKTMEFQDTEISYMEDIINLAMTANVLAGASYDIEHIEKKEA